EHVEGTEEQVLTRQAASGQHAGRPQGGGDGGNAGPREQCAVVVEERRAAGRFLLLRGTGRPQVWGRLARWIALGRRGVVDDAARMSAEFTGPMGSSAAVTVAP